MIMKIKENFLAPGILGISHHRIVHGVKTAIACLIGLTLEKYFEWPMGQWIPITVMVVMSAQTHFGGAVRKASMRFLGTIGGVATAILVLWLFGNNIIVVFCTIFFAGVVFTYIASSHGDISYAGTLGGVTVILVLTGQQVGIATAIQRGFYIIVGIIIALLVSRFIFPIHARDRLRYHVAITLRNLSKLYLCAMQFGEYPDQEEDAANAELNSRVTDDIAAQPRLVYEAVIGSREFAAKKSVFTAILSSEQSLNRLINLMYLSIHEATSPVMVKRQLEKVEEAHSIIGNNFNYLATCFENMEQPQKMATLEGILAKITKVAEVLPKEEEAHQLIVEHSFIFFMEHLLKELENMRRLIVKANSKNKDNVV